MMKTQKAYHINYLSLTKIKSYFFLYCVLAILAIIGLEFKLIISTHIMIQLQSHISKPADANEELRIYNHSTKGNF